MESRENSDSEQLVLLKQWNDRLRGQVSYLSQQNYDLKLEREGLLLAVADFKDSASPVDLERHRELQKFRAGYSLLLTPQEKAEQLERKFDGESSLPLLLEELKEIEWRLTGDIVYFDIVETHLNREYHEGS